MHQNQTSIRKDMVVKVSRFILWVVLGLVVVLIILAALVEMRYWVGYVPTTSPAGRVPNVPPPPISDAACPQIFLPVCGVDGRTYGNRCVAERQYGIPVAYDGRCEER